MPRKITSRYGDLHVFGGPIYPKFAEQIISHLVRTDRRFNYLKGEKANNHYFPSRAFCSRLPNVRESDVFLVDPLRLDGTDIWAMCVMAQAAKLASAARVTAVLPYFEGRQDRKANRGEAITAALALRLLREAGVDRFLTLDPHLDQLQAMTKLPFDCLYASAIFLPIMRRLQKRYKDIIVMGPDYGSLGRNRFYAKNLGCDVGHTDKQRDANKQSHILNVLGNVKGRTVFLADDTIDTTNSFVEAARVIRKEGAERIIGFGTHPLFSTKNKISANQRIAESPIEKLYICDTVQPPKHLSPKIEVVSAAELIAEAILLTHIGGSISTLFVKRL